MLKVPLYICLCPCLRTGKTQFLFRTELALKGWTGKFEEENKEFIS